MRKLVKKSSPWFTKVVSVNQEAVALREQGRGSPFSIPEGKARAWLAGRGYLCLACHSQLPAASSGHSAQPGKPRHPCPGERSETCPAQVGWGLLEGDTLLGEKTNLPYLNGEGGSTSYEEPLSEQTFQLP